MHAKKDAHVSTDITSLARHGKSHVLWFAIWFAALCAGAGTYNSERIIKLLLELASTTVEISLQCHLSF